MSGGFGRKERLQSDVEKLLRMIDMFAILMWLDVDHGYTHMSELIKLCTLNMCTPFAYQ